MSWSTLPPDVRQTAERVLTRKQLDVLKLHYAGMSIRRIALALDVAPSTVEGRLFRARQRMTIALDKEAA